jgi:hypothetical protein
VIDDESLVKTRTNTCLSYASAIPSYSVFGELANGLCEWPVVVLKVDQ